MTDINLLFYLIYDPYLCIFCDTQYLFHHGKYRNKFEAKWLKVYICRCVLLSLSHAASLFLSSWLMWHSGRQACHTSSGSSSVTQEASRAQKWSGPRPRVRNVIFFFFLVQRQIQSHDGGNERSHDTFMRRFLLFIICQSRPNYIECRCSHHRSCSFYFIYGLQPWIWKLPGRHKHNMPIYYFFAAFELHATGVVMMGVTIYCNTLLWMYNSLSLSCFLESKNKSTLI